MVLANTFSIVARCPDTGALGVAVATAVPGVGALCPYIRPRVGAASTQSWVNPYLAIDALAAITAGATADAALAAVLAADPGASLRQIGLVDWDGRAVAHTGSDCTPWCGHHVEAGLAVQGNMLTGPEVLAAMVEAYKGAQGQDLGGRLVAALIAGDQAGGDQRGKQSAALRVYRDEEYPLIDLRVDEHPDPCTELARILSVARHQLLPFVEGMPRRGSPAGPVPEAVTAMLAKTPPDRPGGGGSRPGAPPVPTIDAIAAAIGLDVSPERRSILLAGFAPIAQEIARLRTLDLTDEHPAVVFTPSPGDNR